MTDPAFPDALPAMSRLHWYVVERVLGQGGFGITYLARDTNLDQAVAIKEYLPIDVATRLPDATIRARTDGLRDRYRWGLERFVQEARTLARFDHPNIVRVQSVFEFNNTAYMVMRFVQGQTLSALLDRRGTPPEDELLRIVLPILDGLELVHNAGFIHRDIKPDNIHIGDDGNAVLLDFGSARQALGNSNTLTILIAPGYAPFEQYYSDSSSQGPWTDIYGLGATCYRAIAGRPPLDAVSRSKGILGSTQEVLVPASVIGAGRYSGSFLAAIDHALAFSEKDRPQSIAAWRQELATPRAMPLPGPTAPTATATAPTKLLTAPMAATTRSTAAGTATSSQSPGVPREPVDPQVPPLRPRKPMAAGVVIGAAILAMGLAVYMATTRTGEEMRGELDKLKKTLQDKERSEAERLAQQQRDEEARKRQEQTRLDQEKTVAELARKRDEESRHQPTPVKPTPKDTAKNQQPASMRASTSPSSIVVAPSVPASAPASTPATVTTSIPAPSPSSIPEAVTSAPQSPTAIAALSAKPPAAPQPSTPAQQLAEADRLIGSKQFADALAILQPLADSNNAEAQFRIANAYAEGQGFKQSSESAATWYEKAALQRNIGAQLKLGAMYASANGMDRDNNLACVWYGIAAKLGSAAAKTEMDKISTSLQPAERKQCDLKVDNVLSRMQKKG